MDSLPPPLAFLVLVFAGWVNRQQQAVIDYLLELSMDTPSSYGLLLSFPQTSSTKHGQDHQRTAKPMTKRNSWDSDGVDFRLTGEGARA